MRTHARTQAGRLAHTRCRLAQTRTSARRDVNWTAVSIFKETHHDLHSHRPPSHTHTHAKTTHTHKKANALAHLNMYSRHKVLKFIGLYTHPLQSKKQKQTQTHTYNAHTHCAHTSESWHSNVTICFSAFSQCKCKSKQKLCALALMHVCVGLPVAG